MVNQLQQHIRGNDRATYAYYFDVMDASTSFLPEWARASADHGGEVPFLFGAKELLQSQSAEEWQSM